MYYLLYSHSALNLSIVAAVVVVVPVVEGVVNDDTCIIKFIMYSFASHCLEMLNGSRLTK